MTPWQAPASMAGGDWFIHHSWEVSGAEPNAVGSPLVYSLCQSSMLCHDCWGPLWSSWAVWSVLGWGVLVPMSDLPLCTQFSWNSSTPDARIVVRGALSRLAHCCLFPPSDPLPFSHHPPPSSLWAFLLFSVLFVFWVHDERVRQRKIKKKKRMENLSVSVGTKDQITSLPFILTRGPLLLSPPIVPAKQLLCCRHPC